MPQLNPFHIICIDWSKHAHKRRIWWRPAGTQSIEPLALEGTNLIDVLEYFESEKNPVLVGIDAAIGAPRQVLTQFSAGERINNAGFFQWMNWLFDYGYPDEPVTSPEDWHYSRPFIHVPPGKGSKSAFTHYGIPLHRTVEAGLNSNSPLIVSGIPGTVGSGSRELWRQIWESKIRQVSNVAVWPYDGELANLLKNTQFVLAEIYPKACYGIALSDSLPSPLIALAKTKQPTREKTVQQILDKYSNTLQIENIDQCRNNEDDFDAMISTLALHRLFEHKIILEPKTTACHSEGAVLGKAALILG